MILFRNSRIFLFLFFINLAFSLSAQLGKHCNDIFTIALNACQARNIQGGTNPIEAPLAPGGTCIPALGTANTRDLWFRFTAANTTSTISVTSSGGAVNKNIALVVYNVPASCVAVSNTITNTTELACVNNDVTTAAQTESVALATSAGQTYYVRVIGFNGATNVALNICVFSAPLNDEPTGATSLGLPNASCVNTASNVISATKTNCGALPAPACGNYGASSIDIWYSVTVPGSGDIFLETKRGTAGIMGMAVYAGTPCVSLTELKCSEGNPEGTSNGSPSLFLPGQTPGSTVYIRLWNQNGAALGTFSLCATTLGPCGNSLNNDFCSNPASMMPSASTFSSSTTSTGTYSYTPDAPGNLAAAALCSNSFEHNSWYSFIATATTQTFDINVTATNCAGGLSAQIFSVAVNTYSCCKSFSAVGGSCLTGVTGTNTLTATSLSVGATYYLMMESYGGSAQACTYTVSGWSATGILPIELISFYGENKGGVNYIKWITSSEKNVDAYILESSSDGITFEKVSQVQVKQNSSMSQQLYETYDSHPNKELTYYRLRQFKSGGISDLSHIISVLGPDFYETIHNLYPNPTNSDLNFDFYSKAYNSLKIELFGYSGDVLYETKYVLEEGNNAFVVPMNLLSKGVYILKVVSEKSGKTTHHKIIKN
jgi:hypothetical protein